VLNERLAAVTLKAAAPDAAIEIPDLADSREAWIAALNEPFHRPAPQGKQEILLTALGLRE
jgi:hypothetical protein